MSNVRNLNDKKRDNLGILCMKMVPTDTQRLADVSDDHLHEFAKQLNAYQGEMIKLYPELALLLRVIISELIAETYHRAWGDRNATMEILTKRYRNLHGGNQYG